MEDRHLVCERPRVLAMLDCEGSLYAAKERGDQA